MTFRNILRKTSFSSIFNVLYKEFYYKDSDDETVNTSVSYRGAIAELLSLKSREALSKIHLYTTDAKPYIEVCLLDKNGETFALDLTLWEDLIDCEILYSEGDIKQVGKLNQIHPESISKGQLAYAVAQIYGNHTKASGAIIKFSYKEKSKTYVVYEVPITWG